jgi:hypothetical protein
MSDALFTENRDFGIKFRAVMFWLVRVCPEEAANTVLDFLMRPGIHRVDNFLLLAAIVPKFNPNCSKKFDFERTEA